MTFSELLLISSVVNTGCLIALVVLAFRGKMTGPKGTPGIDGKPAEPTSLGIVEVVTYPEKHHVAFVRANSDAHIKALETPGKAIRENHTAELTLGKQ